VEASFIVTGLGLLAIVVAIAVVAQRSRAFHRAA
jgi:hypothetical protein